MPVLVAGIHVLFGRGEEDVDGRNKPALGATEGRARVSGHDEMMGRATVRVPPIHNVKQRRSA